MLPNEASSENRSMDVRMSATGTFGIRCGWRATGAFCKRVFLNKGVF